MDNGDVCHKCHTSTSNSQNYLLKCSGGCSRSFHHRCHRPTVSDGELARIYNGFLADKGKYQVLWSCSKCTRAKRAGATSSHTIVIDAPPSQLIDLTDSPPTRPVQTNNPVDVIDISDDEDGPSVVDLTLDSPVIAPVDRVVPVGAESESRPVTPLRELVLQNLPPALPFIGTVPVPGTATPTVNFMDLDDEEQKPLLLGLQNMVISQPPPQGGTLGPAWMKERTEANPWFQYFAAQRTADKPLSKRKPDHPRRKPSSNSFTLFNYHVFAT